MTGRDISEIGITALVAALAVTGIFMARPGSSVDPRPQTTSLGPMATVGVCKVTASMKSPILAGVVESVLTVRNPTATPQDAQFEIVLERQVFTGNLGSRVMSAADYKRSTVQTKTVEMSVPASASRDIPFRCVLPVTSSKDTGIMVSYLINIKNGKNEVMIAGAAAPSPSVTVRTGGLVASASTR